MTRVMISIPEDELREIDLLAKASRKSRSQFLRDCVRDFSGRGARTSGTDSVGIEQMLTRLRKLTSDAPGFESETAVRAERDAMDARDRGRIGSP